jgi:hypothetical protein
MCLWILLILRGTDSGVTKSKRSNDSPTINSLLAGNKSLLCGFTSDVMDIEPAAIIMAMMLNWSITFAVSRTLLRLKNYQYQQSNSTEM